MYNFRCSVRLSYAKLVLFFQAANSEDARFYFIDFLDVNGIERYDATISITWIPATDAKEY